MRQILERLGFDAVSKQDRPYITEDFVFEPSDYAAAQDLRAVHDEVRLEETPLTVVRQIHLEHAERPHTSLMLRLGLCWDGFRDALNLLAVFSQSFQRAVPAAAVVNAAERYGTGDFGLAWPWSGEGDPDVLVFVSNNVFVAMEGHDAGTVVLPLARELADALAKLATGGAYDEEPEGLLAGARRQTEGPPRLRPGERLDLGAFPEDDETLFFLTSDGSVNREPDRPTFRYYRAGAQKGRQEIILFRLGKGILPVMERLTVEIS